ncbi:peptide N-acetyl-beta-D-glucosaminyl asparaginase amidase A-domain-containing protein [Umbelopsis sp. AD052]|nr:peptide N-acetyl-beta-D-glucosaminyl asparaginase amidase A-domain-containing protein [Umbelopsis sp. AD052]
MGYLNHAMKFPAGTLLPCHFRYRIMKVAHIVALACFFSFAAAKPDSLASQNSPVTKVLEIEQVDLVPIRTPSTHACKVNIVTHTVGTGPSQTYNTTYIPPKECPGPWSKVVLTYTGASKGRQYDRLSAIWMGGVEVLRTSTAEPTNNGIHWKFEKDVTAYSSVFESEQHLVMELGNVLNDIYNGSFIITTDLTFYATDKHNPRPPVADKIVPVSSGSQDQAWYHLSGATDLSSTNVTLPRNIRAAYLEVYASGQSNDEFWYSNPPTDYADKVGLSGTANGPYREVLAYFDERLIGTTVPHPVVFTGGIVPSLWRPTVSIGGAFNIPSTWIDVSPFVGLMVDGKQHTIKFQVVNAESFWLIDGNLHLWLDKDSHQTSGAVTSANISPNATLSVHEDVQKNLDAVITVKGSRSVHVEGYVDTSQGRIINTYKSSLQYQNRLYFANDTNNSSWAQTTVQSASSQQIPQRKTASFPVHTISTDFNWKIGGGNNFTVFGDQSIRIDGWIDSSNDEKIAEKWGKNKTNSWTFAKQDGTAYYAANALSNANNTHGMGQTKTSVDYRSGNICFHRQVSAYNSTIVSDSISDHC